MKVLNVSTIHVTDDPNDPVHILGMNSTLGQGFHMGGGTDCFGFDHPRHMSVEGYGCFLWQDYPNDMAAEIAGDCRMRTFGPASGKLNHIAVYCGLYLGAAHPLYEQEQAVHGKESVILMPGTKWIKPMYSCVTAVEARIKTVTFAFNTTNDLSADDLSGLTVQKIVHKKYARDQDKPLWGVENFENVSPSALPPLWGLVSPEAVRNMSNSAQSQFQIIQKESLLLPSTGFPIFQGSNHNMPGAQFHTTALGLIDKLGVYRTDTTTADYTGYSNLAMAQRWSNLSRSVHTVGKVVNLIWTDGAANIVVGTKGCAANSNTVIQRAVTVSRLRIRYELPYAVPAVFVLGILAFIAVLTLFALLLRLTSLSKMSRYLNATSAGRIMTAVLQSPTETVDNDTPSGDWVQRQGRADLVVGKERPELVPSGPHDPTGALLGGEETLEGKPGTITATVLRS